MAKPIIINRLARSCGYFDADTFSDLAEHALAIFIGFGFRFKFNRSNGNMQSIVE